MNIHSLEKAKQQWEHAADSMPQLICLVGGDGSVVRANRTLERWSLGEVASVAGHRLHEVLHPHCEDPECYLRLFLRQVTVELAAGRRGQCAAWDPVLNRHFSISAFRPVHEPAVASDFFAVVTIDDISELRAAEARMQRENEELGERVAHELRMRLQVEEIQARLHSILEKNPTLIGMADPHGQLLYLNPAGRSLIGMGGDDELSGMTLAQCHAPGARARLAQEAIPQAARYGVWSGESSLLTTDGRELKVSQVVIAHYDPDGNVEGISVVERDMTDWVRTEEALRTSREELRQLSAQHVSFQESERQRIAADLHDGLGQSLSLIKLSIEQAARLIGSGAVGDAADLLQRLVPRVKEAMGELRRISMDLRPSTLDDLGILPTLSWFFREFEAACPSIQVERNLSVAESDIPAPLKVSIYRIVQEAVSNIVKHARAERIAVHLARFGGMLQLCIEDDGEGFDPAEAAARGLNKGLGLRSMKERAELSGGCYIMESAPGFGTRITVSWPSAQGEKADGADKADKAEQPAAVRMLHAPNLSGAGPSRQVPSMKRGLRPSFG